MYICQSDTDGSICIKTSMMVHFLCTLGHWITAEVDIRCNAVCIFHVCAFELHSFLIIRQQATVIQIGLQHQHILKILLY